MAMLMSIPAPFKRAVNFVLSNIGAEHKNEEIKGHSPFGDPYNMGYNFGGRFGHPGNIPDLLEFL